MSPSRREESFLFSSGGIDGVADIVGSASPAWGYTQQNGNTILYPLHVATPPGNYHIRMNATIYAGNLPLSTIVTSSRTFNISLVTAYQCQTPTFTPVTSISSAAYSPLRLVTPMAGAVFARNALNSQLGNITGTLYIVDGSFNLESLNATLELVNIGTGFSPSVQQVLQTGTDTLTTIYSTANITLVPAADEFQRFDGERWLASHLLVGRVLYRHRIALCWPFVGNFVAHGIDNFLDNVNHFLPLHFCATINAQSIGFEFSNNFKTKKACVEFPEYRPCCFDLAIDTSINVP
ncbi:hypothetical protein B0H12DRAFT_1230965 [Mycena haematopus]|nr:hypothetical protein B0H12DRAFT_1230965 [Mycena haematopus]